MLGPPLRKHEPPLSLRLFITPEKAAIDAAALSLSQGLQRWQAPSPDRMVGLTLLSAPGRPPGAVGTAWLAGGAFCVLESKENDLCLGCSRIGYTDSE